MKFKPVFPVLMIVALLLVACGGTAPASAPDDVSVRLKWTPQVQFSGVYMAQSEGFYAAENLNVTIEPVDFNEMASVSKVVSGQNTFGIASADEIIAARAQGMPVKAIAVIFRISPLLLMSIEGQEIYRPEDLYGKVVAVHAGQAETVFDAFVVRTGLDTSRFSKVGATSFDSLECLQSADVCTGYAIDAVISAQLNGHEPTSLLFGDYGVPFYADVIFTTDKTIEENPELVERFLRATINGWQAAVEDPEAAVNSTLSFAPELDREFQTRSMQATIPLVDTGSMPIGVMEPQSWQIMYNILLEQNAITEFDITTAYTSQFMDVIEKK